MPLYTIPELNKQFDNFGMLYNLEKAITAPLTKPKLKPVQGRICRFCKKGYPATKFKTQAHVIPHQLGNKTLISDFECDECNKKFGIVENDLAYFIGMSRTISKVKGKNGIPNFHSPNDIVTAKLTDIFNSGEGIEIHRRNIDDDAITICEEDGTTIIKYTKNPYRPFNVYVSLLKMILSCIDENDVKKYDRVFKMLTHQRLEDYLRSSAKLMKTTLSFGYVKPEPTVFVFRKRDINSNCPTHCGILYFQNLIFQIGIPYHDDDMQFSEKPFDMHYCPPFSNEPFFDDHHYQYGIIDLNSKELKKDDVESFSMKMDLSNFTKMHKFNPITGESSTVSIEEFKATKMQSILLVPNDHVIPIDKLKKEL